MAKKRKIAKIHIGAERCKPLKNGTKICIKGMPYGYSATLVGKTGQRLPISIPKKEARQPHRAMRAAEKFIRKVRAKSFSKR